MEVLNDEKFLQLTPKMVEFIVRRDTLCIHSEMTVIIALNKWSQYNCKKKKLEPTTSNKVKSELWLPELDCSLIVRAKCWMGSSTM